MLLIIVLPINFVKAKEFPEITNDIEVRYKWYKEIPSEVGEYVPLREVTPNDKVDYNKIKYIGIDNDYSEKNCYLPSEYYLLNQKYTREYSKVYNIKYVLIEDIEYNKNLKIYYGNKPIHFSVISYEDNKLKIDLIKASIPSKLLFFIDNDDEYTISLYRDENFQNKTLSKTFKNQKVAIPDSEWINEHTIFYKYTTTEYYEENSLIKLISEKVACSYKEKYVYKYETKKEYYDDKYHLNVDGYIKDLNNYKIYYKGNLITNTIEVIKEKKIEIPKIEYVYIEKQPTESDSSNINDCPEKTKVTTETKYVEKEVYKTPRKIYIILALLIIIITILIIKICKKHVERNI